MKRILLSLTILSICGLLNAQTGDWVAEMQDPNVNFYTAQQSFENYWKEHTIEKGKGWKQFKRWEAFIEPRVYPDGERPNANTMMLAMQQAQSEGQANFGQWKPMGPFNGNTLAGIGRINRIAFDPADQQTIWMGAPAGGLWKSTNSGQSWTTNTDQLANLGVSDIAINPVNKNIMYLATGDRDASDTYSFGILKSTDGGATWNPTGLVHAVASQIRITDIHINPDNPNVLLTSTTQGIYRSTDAGVNWSRVQTGSYNAMVQKPGNSNVLFVSSLNSPRIYTSTNAGLSWSIVVSNALPTGNIRRIELAVTPHDSNYIYALYGASSSNGFLSICRSTDGGSTWVEQATSPNLLGWSTTGSDVGGQAWYDLALAVNPTNKDELYVGGVNIWRSTDGGVGWNLAAHWFGGGGAPFVHADIHHLAYNPHSGDLYAGTDGGLYRHKTGQFSWDELNEGLNITQYYKIGTAASDTTRIIAGAQDNGTHLQRTIGWRRVRGGDGMDCAISAKNSNVMYASVYYGDFVKSTNGGASFNSNFNLPPSGNGNWVTPFMLDPQHPDTMYAGFANVWRSFNGGASFTDLTASSISGGGNIDVLGIAPNNTNIVFMVDGNRLFKSSDYGTTWARLLGLSVSRSITGVAVAYDDPNHIVVSVSGYSSTEKVYESRDGGQVWTNLSTGIPNLPVNCVTIEDNAQHSVYIGTDIGVYYRDDNSTGWLRFNANLPNVVVTDLEINYINRKLRAGTYGRGVWETPLYSDLVPPVAATNIPQNICLNDTVTLFDDSEYNPTDFKWVISPSTFSYVNGSSDTSQNPQVVFTQKGFYDVGLRVNNILGLDSIYEISALAVGGYPLTYTEDFESLSDFSKWSSSDADPDGWQRTALNGGNVLMTTLYNNFSGNDYDIISPAVDFSGHDSVWLSFDHAYSGQLTNTGDSLLVYIAPSCTDNWMRIAAFGEDGTNSFATTAASGSAFAPSASQWCGNATFATCNVLNLSTYAGMEGVRIRFVAVNSGGNNIYLDNISLEGNPNAAPVADFNSVPIACAADPVTFNDQTYGSPQTWNWSFTGPASFNASTRNPIVNFPSAGVYTVKLVVTNAVGSDSITKSSQITINPADSVSLSLNYNGNLVCSTDTLSLTANANNQGSNPIYDWYLNGVYQATTNSPNFDFTNLTNGDTIYSSLRSDLSCAFPAMAYSDTIVLNVYPIVALQINPVSALCSTGSSATLSATPTGGSFSGAGVTGNTFDPSVTGSGVFPVTYTYQGVNGCNFSQSLNITVQGPPTIVVGSNPDLCDGDGAKQLSLATPLGGVYSGPGVTNNQFDPGSLGSGIHTINYTYTSPSCGPVSKSIDITVNKTDTPAVFVGNNQLECSITASQYQWFDAQNSAIPGANSKIYIPTTNGTYRVDVITSNGCYGQSEYSTFNIGLEEIPQGITFSLFPNPTSKAFSIKLEGQGYAGDLELSLYNGIGVLVQKESLQVDGNYERQFDVNAMAAGVYTINITGKDVQITRKLIIK